MVPFAASQLITLSRDNSRSARRTAEQAKLKPAMVRSGCFAARLADPQLQHDSGRRIQGERRSFACCPTSAAADIDDRKHTRPSLNVVCYRRFYCSTASVRISHLFSQSPDHAHFGSNPKRLLRPCLTRAARCQRLRAARTANAVWILSLDTVPRSAKVGGSRE